MSFTVPGASLLADVAPAVDAAQQPTAGNAAPGQQGPPGG
ncbi:hypothetical protein P3T39_006293 [Kitasatospora sp. GP82]|nr:hypothetical protein [Kitasatospora sp. GP82]